MHCKETSRVQPLPDAGLMYFFLFATQQTNTPGDVGKRETKGFGS
jgi:hypothetical protein